MAEYVICNGRVCVDEGQVKVLQGYGNYITRSPFAPFVYEPIAERDAVSYNTKNIIACDQRKARELLTYKKSLMQRRAASLKPVPRAGYDGEMVPMSQQAQNGVDQVPAETVVTVVTKTAAAAAAVPPISIATPPATAKLIEDFEELRTPSGVKNQQESTFSVADNTRKNYFGIMHLL